jgi:hypothetical protein
MSRENISLGCETRCPGLNQSGNRFFDRKGKRAMNAEAIAAQERLNAQQENV